MIQSFKFQNRALGKFGSRESNLKIYSHGALGSLSPTRKFLPLHRPFPPIFSSHRISPHPSFCWFNFPSIQLPSSNMLHRHKIVGHATFMRWIYIYIYIWLEILLNKTRIKYSEQLFLKMKIFIYICNVF